MTPHPSLGSTVPLCRIGHGYDLHRLELISAGGKPLILGGVQFEHTHGPVAHSDGDALYHAITDALLGALALPDIGQLFPDTAPENAGRDSRDFLTAAAMRVRQAGFAIGNIDCTVILERPKLSPHKSAMCKNIAASLGLELSQVNVKGKTHERVDAVGEGRAVEVHVVAVLFASSQREVET